MANRLEFQSRNRGQKKKREAPSKREIWYMGGKKTDADDDSSRPVAQRQRRRSRQGAGMAYRRRCSGEASGDVGDREEKSSLGIGFGLVGGD
jgi:hypothetical protein